MNDRIELALDHAEAMKNTLLLPKNLAKGHWSDQSIPDLLNHLDREMAEFEAALWGFLHHGEPLERVRAEGSDVSNVIAMIVSNCAELERKKGA